MVGQEYYTMENREAPSPAAGDAANPFHQAHFLLSAAATAQLPADAVAEVAFAGRSNAGKSSAMNALCRQRQLARVSKTPGRTQLLNLFTVPAGGRLVDLPGYGFAQVPLAVRRNWGELVGGYVEGRGNLRGLIVLMDIRHPLTTLDLQMLSWCRARALPCHVLLTKSDKLSRGAAAATLLKVRKELAADGGPVTVQVFSALTVTGVEEARAVVAGWLGIPLWPGAAAPASRPTPGAT
jgi:GTP-binding protein